MRKGRKQKIKSGDEYDAILKAPLCVFQNVTGLKKKIKRALNRRIRKEVKTEIKEEL